MINEWFGVSDVSIDDSDRNGRYYNVGIIYDRGGINTHSFPLIYDKEEQSLWDFEYIFGDPDRTDFVDNIGFSVTLLDGANEDDEDLIAIKATLEMMKEDSEKRKKLIKEIEKAIVEALL